MLGAASQTSWPRVSNRASVTRFAGPQMLMIARGRPDTSSTGAATPQADSTYVLAATSPESLLTSLRQLGTQRGLGRDCRVAGSSPARPTQPPPAGELRQSSQSDRATRRVPFWSALCVGVVAAVDGADSFHVVFAPVVEGHQGGVEGSAEVGE
jgi:hypothetical protein